MKPDKLLTLTCANCGQVYNWTVAEAADYLDAFPANEAIPCCDEEGWFLESDLIHLLMENHVPMCPRCANQLKWRQDDTLERTVEFIYCPVCDFKEVIDFAMFKNALVKT